MARRHGLMIGFALFAIQAFQQGTEIFDFAAQSEHAHFFIPQGAFEVFELAQDFAQLTLHGERALGALLASGDGDVMEALAGLREEEGVGIFEREAASDAGFGDDVPVAEFWEDHFQGFAKAVQYTDGVLQGNDLRRWRRAVCGFIDDERELGLRVFGMDEEGSAAIDAGAQHAQAFVSGVPGLYDDVVQFITEEVFDDALIARFDLEEVG